MDISTALLLLAGSVATAVPIAVAVAAYRGVFGTGQAQTVKASVISQISQAGNDAIQTQPITQVKMEDSKTQQIQEAPAPFPEDSISSTRSPTSTTSVPTDIGAITGMSSVAASASPMLVIATPKRRKRSTTPRRLPSTTTPSGTPRKRRSTKQQQQNQNAIATITTSTAPAAPVEAVSEPETVPAPNPPVQQEV